MEFTRPNPVDMQFSSRFLSRLRPDPKKLPEFLQNPEPVNHRMVYNRSGNLATVTQLNQEMADNFMRRADMRLDIVITDTDTPPENNAVAVSSDTLAFRAIEPIRKLTEVRLKPKPLHTLVVQDDRYLVQIHERQIDDKVRSNKYIDRSDYQEQFLRLLNEAVSAGTSQALSWEKLGFTNHKYVYALYAMSFMNDSGFFNTMSNMHIPLWVTIPTVIVAYGAVVHPTMHILVKPFSIIENKPNHPAIRHSWKEAPLPLLPVDRWIAGKIHLARHGQELVIPKPSSTKP